VTTCTFFGFFLDLVAAEGADASGAVLMTCTFFDFFLDLGAAGGADASGAVMTNIHVCSLNALALGVQEKELLGQVQVHYKSSPSVQTLHISCILRATEASASGSRGTSSWG
jgi:hypothetical protein